MLMSVNMVQAIDVTPAPVINIETTDDAYILTASGEGEVILYVNDEVVENPYYIARPEPNEEYLVIYVYATAQADGKEMSASNLERIVIEPKEGGEPVDPHLEGYWIVLRDRHGLEEWNEIWIDGGTRIQLNYSRYGGFNPETDERPEVPLYMVIYGIRYGAPSPYQSTFLGNALENPLYQNNNCYTLTAGYSYSIGLTNLFGDGNLYLTATRSFISGEDPRDYITGDVDGNAKVTIADVTTMIDYLLSGYSTGMNMDNADVNGSGKVTIEDVTMLIDYLLKDSWW